MNMKSVSAQKWTRGIAAPVDDPLTVERPLHIRINRKPFTVTMRTPGNDFELTRGILFTEGVTDFNQPVTLKPRINEHGEIAVMCCTIDNPRFKNTERSILSSSSCGLCGKVSLNPNELESITLTPSGKFPIDKISDMLSAMNKKQVEFKRSGGCHAAAGFTLDGDLINCFEDIGRHNAVDKVIGDMILNPARPCPESLIVSGRISYEIVSKAAKAGIPILIAVSAPSSLSVEMAERTGMTLIAFCRDDRATVYSHPENVQGLQQ